MIPIDSFRAQKIIKEYELEIPQEIEIEEEKEK